MTKKIVLVVAMVSCLARAGTVRAQAPAPDASRPRRGRRTGRRRALPITDADLKAAVKPTDRANGDPDGALTGTANDIAIADAKAGLTVADVLNQIGANRIGVNFAWTLLCGFLIMFMQAGFAVVEAGLCRAKNANHTMMMNFMVYGVGMLAYFLIGFPLQMGGAGAVANLGGTPVLNSEFAVHLFGKDIGLFGNTGYAPDAPRHLRRRRHGDVPVPDGLHGHATDDRHRHGRERWKYSAFMVSTLFMGAFTYPIFANWAWGGGWLAMLGANFGLGHGYADFAGSGVVHSVGGITALAMAHHHRTAHRQIHARRQAERRFRATTSCGCSAAASSWRSAGSGSTPDRRSALSANGNLRISSVAVNTMLAGMAGSFSGDVSTCGSATANLTRR